MTHLTTIYKPGHRVYPVTRYKEETPKAIDLYEYLIIIYFVTGYILLEEFYLRMHIVNTYVCIYRPNVGRIRAYTM